MDPLDAEFETLPDDLEKIGAHIVDGAFKVHLELGAGLLESVYVACLAHELTRRGLRVRRQVTVPIIYDGLVLDEGFKIDLLVEDVVIVEVKSVEKLHPVHAAQTLTYLKLTNRRLAYLINFNVVVIRQGIKRVINSIAVRPQ